MASSTTNAESLVKLGCSTISFRSKPLHEALGAIVRSGFDEIDLGALPGICDHVPIPPSREHAIEIQRDVSACGLSVRTLNADPGNFNGPLANAPKRYEAVQSLCEIGAEVGATALVLPCGRQRREPNGLLAKDVEQVAVGLAQAAVETEEAGMRLLVEAPHVQRLCHDVERTRMLLARVPYEVAGLVLDVSHVQAEGGNPVEFVHEFGDRIEHVHLRDARLQDISVSVGRGEVNFPKVLSALTKQGYTGTMTMELETHDISESEREQVASAAREYIAGLLEEASKV